MKYERFHRYFEPGFAMTVHSSQSLTIREPYTIHDADYMDDRILYVALGRASSKDIVQIESQHASRFPLNYGFNSVAGKTFQEAARDEAFCVWVNNKVYEKATIPDTVLSRQLIKFALYIHPGVEDEAVSDYAYSESEEEEEEDIAANLPLDHPAARAQTCVEPMQVEPMQVEQKEIKTVTELRYDAIMKRKREEKEEEARKAGRK